MKPTAGLDPELTCSGCMWTSTCLKNILDYDKVLPQILRNINTKYSHTGNNQVQRLIALFLIGDTWKSTVLNFVAFVYCIAFRRLGCAKLPKIKSKSRLSEDVVIPVCLFGLWDDEAFTSYLILNLAGWETNRFCFYPFGEVCHFRFGRHLESTIFAILLSSLSN